MNIESGDIIILQMDDRFLRVHSVNYYDKTFTVIKLIGSSALSNTHHFGEIMNLYKEVK